MGEAVILGQVALGYSPFIDRNRTVTATRLTVFPLRPDAAPNAYKGWVIVETTDGRTLEQIVPHSLGSDANPMSDADLGRKFRDNLRFGGMPDIADRAIEAIDALERAPTIRSLVDLCCRD